MCMSFEISEDYIDWLTQRRLAYRSTRERILHGKNLSVLPCSELDRVVSRNPESSPPVSSPPIPSVSSPIPVNEMSTQKPSPRPPFDDADADVIFRSSDGVDFRLYKVVLAKASPVFQGMFTLPDSQPAGEPQTVTMTEDADTLESLLRFCYPVSRPAFKSLDTFGSALLAAKKYDMPTVLGDLLRSIEPFLHTSSPLPVYLLACFCELPIVARKAARLMLNDARALEPDPMPSEFHTLPCEITYRWMMYHRKCVSAVLDIIEDVDEWQLSGSHSRHIMYSNKGNPHLHTTWVWLSCDSCEEGDSSHRVWTGRKSGGADLHPRRWWTRYIADLKPLLRDRPPERRPPIVSSSSGLCRARRAAQIVP
ncbi:hypothetical protein C8Q80DRAFT_880048 [Daedaleopsis nitida]|nr:hypothetical protein C8Q80DRAFT_880048 [Daedaleopsis nitida]